MIRSVIALLLGGLLVLTGCGDRSARDDKSAQPGPHARPAAEALRSILAKNASFELASYPVGFWNYLTISDPNHRRTMTEQEVEDWHEAGFTLVQGPRVNANNPGEVELMTDMLDWAHERDMKMIVWDSRFWDETNDGLGATLDDFGDHPALFGLHVVDEPIGERAHHFYAQAKRVKEGAPHLHPFVNLGPHHPGNEEYIGVASYVQYLDEAAVEGNLDFLCYDNYVQMNPGKEGWYSYFANLRLVREAGWRHGIPFWTTVLSAGHYRYRRPNYDELRWQFNTAVASGAAGIQYFFYYMRDPHRNYVNPPVDGFWEKTQTYYDLSKVHRTFHRRYGDLFVKLTATRVTFTGGQAYGGGEVFTPNEVLTEVRMLHDGTEGLVGEFVDAEGRRYVMVVNNSTTTPAYVILTFAGGEDVKIYNYGWDGVERQGPAHCVEVQGRRDGALKVGYWLAPGEELVQRVDSELIRNSEISVAMRELRQRDAQLAGPGEPDADKALPAPAAEN